MTNANTLIYDKNLHRAAMLRLYEGKVQLKVEALLDDHFGEVQGLIKKYPNKREFERALDVLYTNTFSKVARTVKRSLLDLVLDQTSFAFQTLEAGIGKLWNVERPPRSLADDIVLKRPLAGDMTLDQGWSHLGGAERARLEKVIRSGIAANKTVDEIALEVRKGNVHTLTRHQSRALVVTSMTSVAAQADHSVYEANKQAIRGWQYVAVLDKRTTMICAHRDGKIFPTDDVVHLPPAHFYCRSTTVPVVKSWSDLQKLEGIAQVRKNNLEGLTDKQRAFYDGQTPMRESYSDWLMRQSKLVQYQHLGDYKKVDLLNSGALTLEQFSSDGRTLGINELRAISDSGHTIPGDTVRFARAKAKLDAIQLGATTVDDFLKNPKLQESLREYYLLQAGELNGMLSYTNYRGMLIGTKKSARTRVLSTPPREDQLKFNPVSGRYEDTRLYQPAPHVHANSLRLMEASTELKDADKELIRKLDSEFESRMSINERAVIVDNLRTVFARQRRDGQVWGSFKGAANAQMKFDVMNISDAIETQIRRDSDLLKRLNDSNYVDPVLGVTQLQDLHDNFLANVRAKNYWEDSTAPKIARKLRGLVDVELATKAPLVWSRLSDRQLQQFYLKFAHRLGMGETPDRDQLAIALGRDLYNLANYSGTKTKWYDLGMTVLNSKRVSSVFEIETFGVQKRRLKSKMSGAYFGPYYDTMAFNIRVVDPRLQEYAKLTRKVDIGLRVAVTTPENKLVFRKGSKTYWIDRGLLGYEDTRIPITSTKSFSDFPSEFVDDSVVDALNWASSTKYKIDPDYYDFVKKLLYFEDDRGNAKKFNELNEYRKFIAARGDAYERFKAMDWLRGSGKAFSNHAFVDHRARIYDRGLISPQSGETFRPFLNTEVERNFSKEAYLNLQDQIGAFLGGVSDKLEGTHNSLTITGRQKIAEKWRPELVKIGNHMLRKKPDDLRAILSSDLVAAVDGEELGKFFRFAIEQAKIDSYLRSSGQAVIDATESLLAERQDVAGLLRMLGVVNNTDANYVSSPLEIAKAQANLIRLAKDGKLTPSDLGQQFKWLHTADIELTDVRRERATYKTFDHATGEKFSKEKIAENKLKFEQRSKGDTRKYLSMQVVEELGEFLEEHLLRDGVPKSHKVYGLLEAQKRALKAIRFGEDTIIKDQDSVYYLKTNKEAATLAAKKVGVNFAGQTEDLIETLSTRISSELPRLLNKQSVANPYSSVNLNRLSGYKTALALEQDASSSGAQIIALTTRNKQLAELSNVVPTTQKRRLYDEIANSTYNDSRFRKINEKLGLSEKDLRKAAKAQNMVECAMSKHREFRGTPYGKILSQARVATL